MEDEIREVARENGVSGAPGMPFTLLMDRGMEIVEVGDEVTTLDEVIALL